MKNAKNITFAQIQALYCICEEIGIEVRSMFYDSRLLHDDHPNGARYREFEWQDIKASLRGKMARNLDRRALMGRELRELQDIDIWEAEGLTPTQKKREAELRRKIRETHEQDAKINTVLDEYFW
jgi:hypothetical protein